MVTFHGIFHGIYWDIPSSKLTVLLLKMAIEIVDFPIEHGDFP